MAPVWPTVQSYFAIDKDVPAASFVIRILIHQNFDVSIRLKPEVVYSLIKNTKIIIFFCIQDSCIK